jgi:signal transduction histidine kinase
MYIYSEPDIAEARESVRLAAHALSFRQTDLRAVLAAVSELSMHAVEAGGGELLASKVRRAGREGLSIAVKVQGGGIEPKSLEAAGLGLAGVKRLVDEYEVSVRSGCTTIHAVKWRSLPAGETMTAEYRALLEYSAVHPGEEPLRRAFAFARKAVLNGLGVIDMAAVHRAAMDQTSHPKSAHFQARSRECLEEALGAFEMVQRGFPEARNAMRHINELLEREAERIAQTLHDEAGQTIAALCIWIDDLECDQAACVTQTGRLKKLVEDAGNLFRGISHELRPPLLEHEGLAPALGALCESLSSRRGLRITFRDDLQRRLAGPVEKVLYRTAQVGLANVVRHAHAENAVVSIGISGDSIVCAIRDDGRGIGSGSAPSGGLGLEGVRERAVALGGRIEAGPVRPHGFELQIFLPDPDALTPP